MEHLKQPSVEEEFDNYFRNQMVKLSSPSALDQLSQVNQNIAVKLYWIAREKATIEYEYWKECNKSSLQRSSATLIFGENWKTEEMENLTPDHLKQYFDPIECHVESWKREERLEKIIQSNPHSRFCFVFSWVLWQNLLQNLKILSKYNAYGYKPETKMDIKSGESFSSNTITIKALNRPNDYRVSFPFKDHSLPRRLLGSTVIVKPINNNTPPMYTVMEHDDSTIVLVIQIKNGREITHYLPPQSPSDKVFIQGFDQAIFKKLNKHLQTSNPPMVYISFGCLAMNPLIAALNSQIKK